MRARIIYAALDSLDAASLPLLPLLLQDKDVVGEQERHIVQHEVKHLNGEDEPERCGSGWLIHVCSLGLGIFGAQNLPANAWSRLRFLHFIPVVTRFPGHFYWGVQLAGFLRITSTANSLTGHAILHTWGFLLEVELQGLQDKHCFPKDLTAAAATQPSPDKSRTMHHV